VKRRDFITLLCGAAFAWPPRARAQQANRMRHIAVIMGFAEDDEVWQAYLATFRQRLHEFGWTDGQNVRFDYRFTGESTERMRSAATEMTAMSPDVIFVTTNPVVSALTHVTRTIPIVFTWVSDSVGSGYVSTFAHPGGNITGFHNYEPALGAKWMGILKEIAPAVRRVAFVHVPEITANVAFMRVGEASSAALGIKVSGAGVRMRSASPIEMAWILAVFLFAPPSVHVRYRVTFRTLPPRYLATNLRRAAARHRWRRVAHVGDAIRYMTALPNANPARSDLPDAREGRGVETAAAATEGHKRLAIDRAAGALQAALAALENAPAAC
jgi:hypothetical protein